MNYKLTLSEVNGVIVKVDDKYIQMMVTDEYDVAFTPFFGSFTIDEELAKQALDIYIELRDKESN